MIRSLLIACTIFAAGCAAKLETAAARHDTRAFALEEDGHQAAALREREKAERVREKLEWQSAADRDFIPPLTAFQAF
jgi:hypothetical protein